MRRLMMTCFFSNLSRSRRGGGEENKLLLWLLLLMATTTTFLTFTLVTGPPLLELPVDRSDDRRDFLSISIF